MVNPSEIAEDLSVNVSVQQHQQHHVNRHHDLEVINTSMASLIQRSPPELSQHQHHIGYHHEHMRYAHYDTSSEANEEHYSSNASIVSNSNEHLDVPMRTVLSNHYDHHHGHHTNGAYAVSSNSEPNLKLDETSGSDLPYTPSQIMCLFQVLQQTKDNNSMNKLREVIYSLPPNDPIYNSEMVSHARARLAFHDRNYRELYNIIQNCSFESKLHGELQKLWYEAHYLESESTRGRKLGAVDKYRLRRKHPLPMTIWDGEITIYCFKSRSREELRKSYSKSRYPQPEEKKRLSGCTGLTLVQGNFSCIYIIHD